MSTLLLKNPSEPTRLIRAKVDMKDIMVTIKLPCATVPKLVVKVLLIDDERTPVNVRRELTVFWRY